MIAKIVFQMFDGQDLCPAIHGKKTNICQPKPSGMGLGPSDLCPSETTRGGRLGWDYEGDDANATPTPTR